MPGPRELQEGQGPAARSGHSVRGMGFIHPSKLDFPGKELENPGGVGRALGVQGSRMSSSHEMEWRGRGARTAELSTCS